MSNFQIAQIKINPDYFRNCARRDYSNPIHYVWIREALQNSLDAGARNVLINTTSETISVRDDGCGMDRDIILNKLLTLGGSQKAVGSTGGFGKAKEILFFTWNQWSIGTSQDKKQLYYIDNTMIGVEPIRVIDGNFKKGTVIEINFTEAGYTEYDWQKVVRGYVSTCTTRSKIYLNGMLLETLRDSGSKSEYNWCTMRVNKSKPTHYMHIRINGITMFSRLVSSSIPATIMIDLKGDSTNILTANRDGLNYNYKYELDRMVEKIAVNPQSTVNNADVKMIIDHYNEKVKKIKALIKVTTNEELVEKLKAIESNLTYHDGTNNELDEVLDEIAQVDTTIANKVKIICDGYYESELGYAFIAFRDGRKQIPINPNRHKSQVILHMWKRIVDKLMSKKYPDMKYGENYMVGFTFKPKSNATYLLKEEKHYILINPTKVPNYGDALKLGNYEFAKACHEISHIEHEDHNEYFTMSWSEMLEEIGNDPRGWTKLFREAKKEVSKIVKEDEEESEEYYDIDDEEFYNEETEDEEY